VQQKYSQADANCTDAVKGQKTAQKTLLPTFRNSATPECPEFIPDKIVCHRRFGRAELAQSDVQRETPRIGKEEEQNHVNKDSAAANQAKLNELEEPFGM
jgi:hypothetical protein